MAESGFFPWFFPREDVEEDKGKRVDVSLRTASHSSTVVPQHLGSLPRHFYGKHNCKK